MANVADQRELMIRVREHDRDHALVAVQDSGVGIRPRSARPCIQRLLHHQARRYGHGIFRFAVRSLRGMADGCGPRATMAQARPSNSPSRSGRRHEPPLATARCIGRGGARGLRRRRRSVFARSAEQPVPLGGSARRAVRVGAGVAANQAARRGELSCARYQAAEAQRARLPGRARQGRISTCRSSSSPGTATCRCR